MQFIDLNTQYAQIKDQVQQRIHQVFAHGQFIMGPEVGELEQALAAFVGVKHAIAVSNGSDALLMALMALDIKAGDEVITTPFTFFATVEMMLLLGIKPVLVDIDEKTYNINPGLIEAAITKSTKAIMPVSLYGQCADLQTINQIAAKYQLPVIEDAAQSFGASHHAKLSCAQTTVACTSFFPAKPLGAYGDAGAMFTDDDALAEKIRCIHLHGETQRYQHTYLGINGRMDTLQAAMMLPKLAIYPQEIAQRRQHAAYYDQLLAKQVTTPYIEPFNQSVYAQYTIQVDDREQIREHLQQAGIPTAVHYPKPVFEQAVMQSQQIDASDFPITQQLAKRVLSLPFHPYLQTEDMTRVAEALFDVLK